MSAKVGAKVWVGRILSGLACAMFVFSAVLKLKGGEEFEKGMAQFGLPVSMMTPLAILELACVVIYLIPATAVVGAILLAGYMGGAICTHWRVGDSVLIQVLIGVAVWGGLWFRDARVRALIPFRSSSR